MRRRDLLKAAGTVAAAAAFGPNAIGATPADALPKLSGALTLYLGRGEGGLYENVIAAIEARNPDLELKIRRGPTAALAQALVAEASSGIRRADLFWAVDAGAVGFVREAGLARALPADLTAQLQPAFRYDGWAPITGRIRTLPFNSDRISRADIPHDIMALPESGLRIGWAPAYASFQSFVTAMRLLEGDAATADWLRRTQATATSYAGELGVVLGVERGEVDVGFANHYYTLRLKSGRPHAKVALAFTRGDAGSLINASGVVALSAQPMAKNFVRYLLSEEVQSYLAREAFEIPLAAGMEPPPGLAALDSLTPPDVDLTQLADLRPTLELMRSVGVL